MKNVHYDLIMAWANGSDIEWYNPGIQDWEYTNTPAWVKDADYRIKPNKGTKTGWINIRRGDENEVIADYQIYSTKGNAIPRDTRNVIDTIQITWAEEGQS